MPRATKRKSVPESASPAPAPAPTTQTRQLPNNSVNVDSDEEAPASRRASKRKPVKKRASVNFDSHEEAPAIRRAPTRKRVPKRASPAQSPAKSSNLDSVTHVNLDSHEEAPAIPQASKRKPVAKTYFGINPAQSPAPSPAKSSLSNSVTHVNLNSQEEAPTIRRGPKRKSVLKKASPSPSPAKSSRLDSITHANLNSHKEAPVICQASNRKSVPGRASPALSPSPAKLSHLDHVTHGTTTTTTTTHTHQFLKNSVPNQTASRQKQHGDKLFYTYADKLGVIGPEGIEALCSSLGIDHTDIKMLILAWKLNAENQGYFTLVEWQKGMNSLQVDTIGDLKQALSLLEEEVKMPENFEHFNTFAFQYCLTEDRQKCIDIETICTLLDLVLGFKFRAQVDSFTEFLKSQDEYKMITLDQWTGFFRFCNEISFPDVNNYSFIIAWPSIIDSFVEWMKAKQG